MKVWVLVIKNKHGGVSVSAHAHPRDAFSALYHYVNAWWDDEMETEIPTDRRDAINEYFENGPDEWTETHELEVEGLTPHGAKATPLTPYEGKLDGQAPLVAESCPKCGVRTYLLGSGMCFACSVHSR